MKIGRLPIVDYLMIAVGIAALVCTFLYPYSTASCILSMLAGFFGLIYLTVGLIIYFNNRVKFDWHLVKGNYIMKVVALVLLMPCSISLVINMLHPVQVEEFIYEDNLYVQQSPVDSLVIAHNDSLSVVVPLYTRSKGTLTTESPTLPKEVKSRQENPPFLWGVYFHFMDPGNQHMTSSKDGRLWAVLIAVLGVFLLNGLLVSSIVGWIDSRKSRWIKGEIHYDGLMKCRRHYVVIGGNDMSAGIIQQLFNRDTVLKKPYVLVLTSRDVEGFRRELFTVLTEEQQKRIVIYYGSRTSPEDIKSLQLASALEVYVLGEDPGQNDAESYHDTMNMECIKLISHEIADVERFKEVKVKCKCENKNENGEEAKENQIVVDDRLVCRVMFEYQTTFNIFQVTDIDGNKIKFMPFNYYEKWAQNVLICRDLFSERADYKYLPLEGVNGIKYDDPHHVHLVVIGMSRMGIAMAIEAAHLAHYPNFEENGIKTKITFIDKNAAEEKDFFIGRFKNLFELSSWKYGVACGDILEWVNEEKANVPEYLGDDFIDIEWEFLHGSVETPAVQQYLSELSADANTKLTIAVCLPENSRAIAAAAYLPDKVYESDNTLQVLVYQRLNDELVRQISENNKRYHRQENGKCYKKMKAFGMASKCYDFDLVELSEFLGDRIHKAYDIWREKNIKPVASKQEQTVDSTESKPISAQMWSNQYNVHSMWTKFRCVTTSDNTIFNPLTDDFADFEKEEMMTRLGKVEHNRWVVEQLLLRYRPLDDKEQADSKIDNDDASSKLKDEYKKNKYAHLDICSNEKLKQVDFKMASLDIALISQLPGAYKEYMEIKTK